MPNKCIWTLPTSSEQSFSFALCRQRGCIRISGLLWALRPGHSAVRAAGAKRSIDHRDHDCYRPCSAAGLACSDSAAAHHNHKKTIVLTDYPRRQAGFTLCQLPLKRRSWHHTAQQILTSLLASAAAALLWPIRALPSRRPSAVTRSVCLVYGPGIAEPLARPLASHG